MILHPQSFDACPRCHGDSSRMIVQESKIGMNGPTYRHMVESTCECKWIQIKSCSKAVFSSLGKNFVFQDDIQRCGFNAENAVVKGTKNLILMALRTIHACLPIGKRMWVGSSVQFFDEFFMDNGKEDGASSKNIASAEHYDIFALIVGYRPKNGQMANTIVDLLNVRSVGKVTWICIPTEHILSQCVDWNDELSGMVKKWKRIELESEGQEVRTESVTNRTAADFNVGRP
jgi:hypothetical protein